LRSNGTMTSPSNLGRKAINPYGKIVASTNDTATSQIHALPLTPSRQPLMVLNPGSHTAWVDPHAASDSAHPIGSSAHSAIRIRLGGPGQVRHYAP
jgi:hypothetical protein